MKSRSTRRKWPVTRDNIIIVIIIITIIIIIITIGLNNFSCYHLGEFVI